MKVLFIDKTAVLESSHERYEKISRFPDIRLAVLSPVRWYEHMRWVSAERRHHPDYGIFLGRTLWSGSYSRGFYISGLKRALREFRPDIIQLLEEPWSFFAAQTTRLARRTVPEARILFYTWENIFREDTYCSRLDPVHRRIERLVFSQAASGICATELAARVLRMRGFKKDTPVIPYGVSERFFLNEQQIEHKAFSSPHSPVRVGYVGRVLEMKGIDVLIRALALVNVHLVILGNGPAESSLKNLADDLGVSERITWTPSVPPEQVVDRIRELDVLVLPSRTTPTWAEQLGRVLLEAMASGVPVIGSSSGSIPEVVGEEGLIFREGNPEDLALSIQRITNEAELRSKLIINAWKKARIRYSWNRFATDLVEHYRALLR